VIDIHGGQNCDVAIRLDGGSDRPVFLKGVHGVSPRMRWLRNEITAGQLAAGVAPAVLWHEDVDDWLVVAFEFLTGREADLAPDSPDLSLVASLVDKISALPAPGLVSLRERWAVTNWWYRLADADPTIVDGWDVDEATRWATLVPELVDGDRLVHTDLHGAQFLIGTDNAVHVIDWGWPAAGAPWVDTAFLVLRLIEAGHPPADAEAWAQSLVCWSGVDATTLTAFTVYVAGLWSYRAVTHALPGAANRARLVRDYAARRINRTGANV
jgi:hypothetical protein